MKVEVTPDIGDEVVVTGETIDGKLEWIRRHGVVIAVDPNMWRATVKLHSGEEGIFFYPTTIRFEHNFLKGHLAQLLKQHGT